MNVHRIIPLLLPTALLVGCGGDRPPEAVTAEHEFFATFAFETVGMDMAVDSGVPQVTFDGRCSQPSDWVIRFRIRGDSTSLGPLTGTAEHCSQVLAWRATDPPAPDSVTYADGQAWFVTTDGDTLTATYGEGVGGMNADGETMWFRDHVTFTGGTGRFAGARGEAEEKGTFVAPDLPAAFRAEGHLRLASVPSGIP